jgi:hypothetical protein
MLLPCWRTVATLVEVVALNAFVSKSVDEEGSTDLTPSRASRKFFWGRGFPSSRPHMSQNLVEGALSPHLQSWIGVSM